MMIQVNNGRVSIVNKTTSWDEDRCNKGDSLKLSTKCIIIDRISTSWLKLLHEHSLLRIGKIMIMIISSIM